MAEILAVKTFDKMIGSELQSVLKRISNGPTKEFFLRPDSTNGAKWNLEKKIFLRSLKSPKIFFEKWKKKLGIFLTVSPGQYLCCWWWNKIKWKVKLLLALKRMKRDMKINSVWTLPWILQWLTYCSLPSCHLYTNHLRTIFKYQNSAFKNCEN